MNTTHSHPVVFGRREPGCPRCVELTLGAPARQWRGYSTRQQDAKRVQNSQRIAEIRAHDCNVSRCGPVCTFGEW